MYYLFQKQSAGSSWHFVGEFETKEDCEYSMDIVGEPIHVEYKIIKGEELNYEEKIPVYSFNIIEEEK